MSVGEIAVAIAPTLDLSISQPFGLQLCVDQVGGFVELDAEIVVEFGNRVCFAEVVDHGVAEQANTELLFDRTPLARAWSTAAFGTEVVAGIAGSVFAKTCPLELGGTLAAHQLGQHAKNAEAFMFASARSPLAASVAVVTAVVITRFALSWAKTNPAGDAGLIADLPAMIAFSSSMGEGNLSPRISAAANPLAAKASCERVVVRELS